ncbi:isoaspartyl peptidase/L-asparaginase-like [Dendronephthya gigantea]|uniref:isoaspartyl peptidase/L-asparaginase-like n=1 Tax=Dendronephthya gigantea TaxID=151771 RepID=UPI00106AB415|nr:isoaspartyl peptidase/L-asparaginase-like [Dendronephthya gigantea]
MADSIKITIEIPRAVVRDVIVGAVGIGAIYAGYRIFRGSIDAAVTKAFGGERSDQKVEDIKPGSLHVCLRCFTDERFLEVLEEYKSGKIKERLEKELSDIGIETEGLVVVGIENIKEVEKKAAALKISAMTTPQIIVQGGAYWQKPRDTSLEISDDEYKNILKESAKTGYAILMRDGGTAVDAVEAAVRVLEDSEHFDAGYGSLLNNDGEVECDAMIMDGNTLDNGAVITGRNFRNPVSLAKKIMNETVHCALSGEGALQFAQREEFPISEQEELISPGVKKLQIRYPDFVKYERNRFKGIPTPASDTVSAVARDANGYLACATSTGGVAGRMKGRVSDASLVGCGGYANEHGAATTSGLGESIMKMTLAREVVYQMEGGRNAQESAVMALDRMRERLGDVAGVTAIDNQGNFGRAFTTEMMVWASIKDDKIQFGLKPNEVEEEKL